MKRHDTHKRYNLSDKAWQTAATAKNLLIDAIINFQNNGNTNHAAAIAFYSLLSVVPLALLTALTASLLLGSYADFYASLHTWLKYYQPGLSMDVFAGVIDEIGDNIKVIGSFALLTTLWFSSFVFGAIETAFNAIFRSHKIRNYVVSKVLATAMIPLCWLVASGLVFANYFAEILFKHPLFPKTYIVYPFIQEWIFPIVLPFVVACIFFALIYKLLPTNKIDWKNALAGGAMFCLLLNLAKGVFAWYIVRFCAYGVIFGGLEKMIILLIWVFYVAFIFLFCAELIAAYERRDLLLIEKTLMAKNAMDAAPNSLLFRRLGRFYKRGALIIAEGERSTDLYYVLSGKVILTRKSASESQETPLQTLVAGSFFGEMAAITGGLPEASVYAAADSDIACIDAATLRRLIRENEGFTVGILLRFAQNAREATARANSLAFISEKMALVSFFAAHPQGATPKTALASMKSPSGRGLTELHAALASLQEEGILVVNAEGCLVLAGGEKAAPISGS